jgi:hypothetical protein
MHDTKRGPNWCAGDWKHRRYGYRMLHAKLVREGFRVDVIVVERLCREERLALRRRNRKKIPKGAVILYNVS